MKIYYDERSDLLYIRFDEEQKEVVNKRVTEDIVLDMEDEEKIIGIEILDAAKHVNLAKISPIHFGLPERKSIEGGKA